MDKGQAAIAAMEFLGWTFDGKRWNPPKSKWGPDAIETVEAMAGYLQGQIDMAYTAADTDVYWQSVVDQIGPILSAWEETKPKGPGFV